MIRELMGDDVSKKIEYVKDYFIDKQKPSVFNPYEPDCYYVLNEKSFEEVCMMMEESGVTNPKDLTVLEFQSKINYLQKKSEKIKSTL